VDAASTLAADALSNGAGGRVIVWADDTTTFAGSITARGGSAGGDGGWVETSGRRTLNFAEGRVDASAATGAAGLWLLDPSDITLGSAEAAAIQDSLIVGNSVTISTIDGAPTDIAGPPGSGDITLVSPIVASVTNTAVLTLTASRYIQQAMGFETIDLFGGALVLNVNQEGLAVPGISTVSNALATIGTVTEGTTLNLGAGTYQEEGTIFIDDSLTLNGAGVGSTILDGSISSDRVLTVADDVTVTLSNLTITNGVQAEGGGGGGLLNEGILTILNSAIVGNEAFDTNGGGGISNLGTLTLIGSNVSDNTNNSFSFGFGGGGISNDGSLTLQDSTISGNTTDGDGGGILNNGSLVISNSTISDNTAVSGGGILNNGSLALENSVLTNNIADFLGGALSNSVDATARITGSTLSSNEADFGGGINNSGTLTITTSTLSNNTATGEFGGGAIGSSGPLTLANSTLNGNLANLGGGLYNRGPLTVSNSTFSGNSAFQIGGGLANFGGDVTVTNSTLSGNRAGDAGGGLSNRGDLLSDGSFTETGQLTVTSSLVSGNTNSSGLRSNLFSDRPFTSGGNNLFGSDGNAGVSGASLAASDIVPLVALSQILNPTLSDNGGPTPTLALVPGSPALDRGAGANGDQRGQAVVNGIRDIGAFEFTGVEVPPPVPPPVPEPPVAPHPPDVPDAPDAPVSGCVSGDCGVTIPQGTPEPPTGAAGPVQTYENYLQVQAVAFEDFDALKRAAQITGVTPALVYAQFVTSSGIPVAAEATAIALPKSLATADPVVAQILAQAEGGPGGTTAADDVLELVLVTGEGEPRRFSTGATRTEVLAAVQQLQRELTDRTRRRLDNYLVPAQALYGWLMAPLEATLQDEAIGHVSFILDEGLRSLPLAALHDGEQYIIENYSVGLMPSLSLTDTRIGDIRNAAVLATGASQFSDQPPLPAVPVELAAINSLWPSEQYLNEAFTPEAIARERAAAAYPILHLATHGQFTNGALGNSYIQFWDRRLGLDQLPQLGLNDPAVELLVLSACRTVLGGEEAELGFAGLAIKSGAKSAIAALWQVSDLETAGLMAELYTQLGQVTYKAEALRQAQLAMLRGDITVQDGSLVWSGGSTPLPPELTNFALADTRHPFYWSAFTLVGSPW
ncbi:MAG TPA: CHAT domain-containing protein, partial [Candidatus Obscuribacterales bacterium]